MEKTYKIPVTWEVYGTVEVKASSVDEALKKYHKIEDNGAGFSLPEESNYVDGSFHLSNDDEDELKDLIALIEVVSER